MSMTPNGAFQALFWSLPPISALQTMHSQTTTEVGATLLSTISISPSPSSSILLNTELESSLSPTEGAHFGLVLKIRAMNSSMNLLKLFEIIYFIFLLFTKLFSFLLELN